MSMFFNAALVSTASLIAMSTSIQAQTLSTAPPTPSGFIDQFEATFGKFEGYRRSGAKGICAAGEFVGSVEGRNLSQASVFSGKPVPVVLRFSVGGANPKAPDNAKSQRNMALAFSLPNGEQWLMGNISAPVFGAESPEQFFALVASRQPDAITKMPDPSKVKAFNDSNPQVLLLPKYLASQPVPASYASVNYWGVHGFGLVNAAGATQYGKWVFEPVAGVQGLSDEEAKAKGPSFLFDDLRQRVRNGQVAFDFNFELAQTGDNIDNATVPLPAGRQKVRLGTLKVTTVDADAGGDCLTINFNPLVMPKGVLPSKDPLLTARAAPYAISLGRRLSEGAKQQ
jgi:catalase